jgi:hypothetical protein
VLGFPDTSLAADGRFHKVCAQLTIFEIFEQFPAKMAILGALRGLIKSAWAQVTTFAIFGAFAQKVFKNVTLLYSEVPKVVCAEAPIFVASPRIAVMGRPHVFKNAKPCPARYSTRRAGEREPGTRSAINNTSPAKHPGTPHSPLGVRKKLFTRPLTCCCTGDKITVAGVQFASPDRRRP